MKKLFALLLFCFPILIQAQDKKTYTHADSLRGSLNPARMYDVKFYDLKVKVFPETKSILGVCCIWFTVEKETDSIQVDLFSSFQIQGMSFMQTKPKWRREGNHLFIKFTQRPEKGKLSMLKIFYEGKPIEAKHAPWDGGFVWTKDSLGNPWVAVACEGTGASCWWPCKDHLSDEPDSMRIICQVPDKLYCVSNGTLVQSRNVEHHYAEYEWFVHYPINTYNVTLNIGDYKHIQDSYRNINGELMDVDYYPLRHHEKRAKEYFPAQVKDMLGCFEKYFGAYPCSKDGYGLVETPYYGMEHQGAIAYGNYFKNESHGLPFDFIIVHESGHEWFGNSLSCADEAEMWLHEGFTTYSEAVYAECKFGYEKALQYLLEEKKFIKNEKPMISVAGVNDFNRKDNDIYYKGSWVLHTLRNLIHDDKVWFKLIYDFTVQNKHKIISTQDFVAFVNKRTGKNYDAFFTQYLRYAAVPELQYSLDYSGGTTTLNYRWNADVKNFNMPLYISTSSGNSVLISPTEKWQKTKLKDVKPADVSFPDSFYLFTKKDVQEKNR